MTTLTRYEDGIPVSEQIPDQVLTHPAGWTGRGILIELAPALVLSAQLDTTITPTFRFLLCTDTGSVVLAVDEDVPGDVQPWDYAEKLAAEHGVVEVAASPRIVFYRDPANGWTAWDHCEVRV